MSDDKPMNEPGAAHDLRTVSARLIDLQRKCRSAGSRNSEAEEVEQRLNSILDRLEPGDDDDTPPIPFAGLARELYGVERFFESNGFLTVAKEVAHVERLLESLAADDEPEVEETASHLPVASGPDEIDMERSNAADEDTLEGISRWAVPRPLAIVFLLFVAAVMVCAAIIYRMQYAELAPETSVRPPLPPSPVATRPAPTPVSQQAPRTREATPAPGAVLAREIGLARLALADGDIDAVIDHLSRASLIDSDHTTVLGTANQLVDQLVDRADSAADGGLWEIADLTLVRADRLATRYGLDHHRIEAAVRRHAQMERFRLVQASDPRAIRAATGSRVTVVFRDGSTRESIIKGVDSGHLLLDEDTEVRGGAMYFTEKIPLAEIDYLKVWE